MNSPRNKKVCSVTEAIATIPSGCTLACGGFIGSAHPEALTSELEIRFLETGEPNNLTLVYGAGQGDGSKRGLNHLAQPGMIKRVIGGHWGLAPALGAMALRNEIEAYNFPQGVICQLFRDIAAKRPGCITHVGLGTFVDPIQSGGKLNSCTTEDLVQRIELSGQTWLWYKAFPLHVALIRATAADPFGGLICDEEAILGEALAIAQAVHNHGGIVIAQVKRLLDSPAGPHCVRVPGILVDKIVVAEKTQHELTFAEAENTKYYSAAPPNTASKNHCHHDSGSQNLPIDERFIIASRACDELTPGSIANLGIGMPEGIATIARERGLLQTCTLTIESGPIGGAPASGLSFGAAEYPQAIVDQPAQFDFYDGGGLDFAALGAAQIDQHGNVNVSKFGTRLAGIGGFANISHNARKLVFCGTFTAGGLKVLCEGGQLAIVQEGASKKFTRSLEQICFAAEHSRRRATDVFYVTERAVFKLDADGLRLIEIAPGIDLERDVLAQMEFAPIVRELRLMGSQCFFRQRVCR